MLVQYPEFIENLKCPVILSLRGTQINVSPLADKKLTFLYKQYFPRINRFHAVSQSISKEAEKYGADINQITVISPSVDDKYLNDKTYKVDGVFSDVLNIVSVGRCHWIKGYTFALDTMAILKKEGVQFHYTIIAGGRDSENIYYQIDDLGLNECVSFMNGLPHDEVMRKLSGSDLFLLPSLEEGISNAVMEAMALGVPVISTNCGGMGEVIKNGENGFLVPLRDPDSTAQAIIDFIRLDEKSKITIVNNARDTIIQSHLLSHQVARFKSLYSNII
jgi:colanic acid/amylovoran biosynthesis glycosyltransferase